MTSPLEQFNLSVSKTFGIRDRSYAPPWISARCVIYQLEVVIGESRLGATKYRTIFKGITAEIGNILTAQPHFQCLRCC